MDINEMEFQWRLNWWYRPTQLDGFESSVADYYDCFCDWKANMELNSCPADEADYVDAFIQNLNSDIRSRLESKGRLSMRSLRDVFSDAQFMESLISIEDAFKKFAAKFEATLEARNLFDKMPSQVPVNCQENLSGDEFSGLEDEGNDSATAYETSIDEIGDKENDELLKSEAKGNYDREIISPIASHKLFNELPKPALTGSTASNLIEDDGKPTDLVFPVFGNMVEQLGACKVFDELPKSALTTSTAYMSIDVELDVDSGMDSQTAATFEQVLGNTENEAPRILIKSKGLEFTCLKSFRKGLIQAEFVLVKAAYQVFEKMPQLSFVWPFEELNSSNDSLPLNDCGPKEFDPGDSTQTVAPVGLRFNKVEDLFASRKREDVLNNNKILIYPLYEKSGNVMVLMVSTVMFYIDPGGSMSHQSCFMGSLGVQNLWMKMGCSKIGGASVDLQEDVYGNKDSLPFSSHALDFIRVVNRNKLDSGIIFKLSKFSTQGVSKKFPTSESEVGIEFEKWRSRWVVEGCCRLCDLGGAMRRNEYELLLLARTRANNIDEIFVSVNLMINEISRLNGHSIRFVMLASLWCYISVLLLDMLWFHMINFPFMSKLGFNPQVYDPGTCTDLIGILAHSVPSHPFDHGGLTKACKPQMQVIVDHLSCEALNKDHVDLPSAIKVLLEILVKGSQIFGRVTWQTKLHGPKMVVLAKAAILDNFVWDPGLGVNFFLLERG